MEYAGLRLHRVRRRHVGLGAGAPAGREPIGQGAAAGGRGPDDDPAIRIPDLWPTNLGSERDWAFQSEPNPCVNGRALTFSMGKALGGGSAINVMLWARGHKADWDFVASEAGDPAWGYESVLDIYRAVENWHGKPDPRYRGTAGPVFVAPAPDPHPLAHAVVEAAGSLAVPTFENANGRLMEATAGHRSRT